VQTCYAKWLSICSGYCEFNALVYVRRVELSLFLFFHLSYSFLFLCCLLVLPYYMVNTYRLPYRICTDSWSSYDMTTEPTLSHSICLSCFAHKTEYFILQTGKTGNHDHHHRQYSARLNFNASFFRI